MKTIYLTARALEAAGLEIVYAGHPDYSERCKENAARLAELFADEPTHLTGTARAVEEAKKRHYFVAYNFQAEGHSGNGCMDLVREKPIRNWQDVEGICKFIAEYKGFKSVALTGWQHYEEDT